MDNSSQELDHMALDVTQESVAIESYLSFIESLVQRHELDEQNLSAIFQAVNKARYREQDSQLYLGIVGEFNSDKNTLINALIREDLLKTDIVQGTTSALTLIRYAEKPDVVIRYKDKAVRSFQKNKLRFWLKPFYALSVSLFRMKQQKMLIEFLESAIAETTAPKDVEEVTFFYPANLLKQGVVLIDIPGLNSLNDSNTQVFAQTVRELCDACIIVIPSNNLLSPTVLGFLKNNLGDILHRCIFVVTEMDLPHGGKKQEMLLENIEAWLLSELNLEQPVIVTVAPKEIVDLLYKKKTKIKQNPGAEKNKYVEQFDLTEKRLVRIMQSNKFLIQVERVYLLLSSILRELEEYLRELEAKYRLRHEALLKNQIIDLGKFVNEQKRLHNGRIKTGIIPIREQAVNYVVSVRNITLNKVKEAIYDSDSKSSLRDTIKTKPEVLMGEANQILTQKMNSLFPEILKVDEVELREFEKSFKELYKSLATLGGIIPFNQATYQSKIASFLGNFANNINGKPNTIREEQDKLSWRALGAAGFGSAIGLLVCPALGSVTGSILGGIVGALFGPSLDELKAQYWGELENILSSSFANTEYRVIEIMDATERDLCGRLGGVIDRYFEKYDQLIKEMIARDQAEAAKLQRNRNLIREDLTRIIHWQSQVQKAAYDRVYSAIDSTEAGSTPNLLSPDSSIFSNTNKEIANTTIDRVHFMLVSPSNIEPGKNFVLDVWAYQDSQRNSLLQLIKEELKEGEFNIKTKGPTKIKRETLLTLHLKIESLIIQDPEDSIYWDGECSNASFAVRVPPEIESNSVPGEINVYIKEIKIMRISFTLDIGQDVKEKSVVISNEIRFQKAFASYASADRDEVLSRIQGIQKIAPEMKIFIDVISLRSGQYWEKELWKVIPNNDIFYLFWSENAQKSEWVAKEWHCALQTKGLDFIDPIPLVSPDIVPPPKELASKHFNDWTLMCKRNKSEHL